MSNFPQLSNRKGVDLRIRILDKQQKWKLQLQDLKGHSLN